MELVKEPITDIPTGYKKTKLGIIPDDWKIELFKDIFSVNQGLQIAISRRHKYPTINSKKYLTIQFLNDGKKVEYVSDYSNGVCCVEEDILMTRTGNTGVVVSGVNGVFHNNFFKIKFDEQTLNREFLIFFLKNTKTQRRIMRKAGTSTIPDLNHNDFYSLSIPLPPTLKEQKAIAKALTDVDKLISNLDRLIAKKKAIKRGMMQELLTGKTRLGDFGKGKGYKQSELGLIPEDWENCTFNEVVDGFSSGMTPYRGNPEYYHGNIPWITSGELNYNVVEDTIEKITPEAVKNTNLKVLPIGTFLMAITGLEAAGTRGSCAITGVKATTNQSCMALFPKKEKLITMYLYFFYINFGEEFAFKYCQGSKQQSYTGHIAKKLPIVIPPTIEEQTLIVEVVSKLSDELSSLIKKNKKLKKLKQGMMQELLTGKTRLV